MKKLRPVQFDMPIPNTLGTPAQAEFGLLIERVEDALALQKLACEKKRPAIVLGQGSNVILRDHVRSCIGLIQIQGITYQLDEDDQVYVTVQAGEDWTQFVDYCVDNGWHGIENLALIPGTVGAAPIQNIGAYGVELSDVLHKVEVITPQGEHREYMAAECRLGYRHSRFKEEPGHIVLSVTLCLQLQFVPRLAYPVLKDQLAKQINLSAHHVLDAVKRIRRSKLPNPKQVPNVGSFFKNPIINRQQADGLAQQIEGLQTYATHDANRVKLSAAQLLDICGAKRYEEQGICMWHRHALVLTNPQHRSAQAVLNYAQRLSERVAQRFEVQLELEPSIVS